MNLPYILEEKDFFKNPIDLKEGKNEMQTKNSTKIVSDSLKTF